MDREIPQKEINARRIRRLITGTAIAACAIGAFFGVMKLLTPSLDASEIIFGTADIGTIETTVNATGKVVPEFEEIINAPISSRILEVYCKAGDSVTAGTPLLCLDLQSAETEMRKLSNEHDIQAVGKEKAKVVSQTTVSDLEMKVKVKEMSVQKLYEDMANEKRLDSIGSGTGERIRQAELAYNTARLELVQLRQQLDNERMVQAAELQAIDLGINIASDNIDEMRRKLDDARLKAPRSATLTYIINEIGRQVNQGEKVAVIADLRHFKVEGEIPDLHAQKFGIGSKGIVQVGKTRFEGTVTNIVPQSQGGIIKFTITLDDSGNDRLRSGQSAQVYIVSDIMEDVMRIPAGPYYSGPGIYSLFVKTSDNEIQRHDVHLGESNYDFVEVIDGIKSGDVVVISDLKELKEKNTLKLKNTNQQH